MNEQDRETLDLAAKAAAAAGAPIILTDAGPQIIEWTDGKSESYRVWRPDADDGDGARLEAALAIEITWNRVAASACVYDDTGAPIAHAFGHFSDHSGDKQAARRMATVRCAAALAKR